VRKKYGESITIKAIEEKKDGRPLMLGEELDRKIRAYIH